MKSPKYLLCIDEVKCKFLGGLSHQTVQEKKTKKQKTKMHAKLQCLMGQWPYELKGHTRHIAHQHGEDMEYSGMSWGMCNLDRKHH